MAISYRKDFNRNYLVIDVDKWNKEDDFGYQMIYHNKIEGILPVENRMIDNKTQLFYDITGKQPLELWMERTVYDYEKIKKLYMDLINMLEHSREYLLCEDDFMISSQFIYVDIITGMPYLCYRFGYKTPVLDQITTLTEYFMNKVDYSNKEGVYLIYRLHAVGKESGFTLYHLKQVLYEEKHCLDMGREDNKNSNSSNPSIQQSEIGNSNLPGIINHNRDYTKVYTGEKLNTKDMVHNNIDNNKEAKINSVIHALANINHRQNKSQNKSISAGFLEKVESDNEKECYPVKSYLLSGIVILIGLGIFFYCMKSGLFYNSYGKRIDYVKLLVVFVMILSVAGYILSKIWSKKSRITKIVREEEVVDIGRIVETSNISVTSSRIRNDRINNQLPLQDEDKQMEEKQMDDKSTCVLNMEREKIFRLKEIADDGATEYIIINKSPFFLGKLKKNVDYCIENEGVSRYHAKITEEEGNYYITDLNSMNGTFVNEKPVGIYEKLEIVHGDILSIATSRFLCEQIN